MLQPARTDAVTGKKRAIARKRLSWTTNFENLFVVQDKRATVQTDKRLGAAARWASLKRRMAHIGVCVLVPTLLVYRVPSHL